MLQRTRTRQRHLGLQRGVQLLAASSLSVKMDNIRSTPADVYVAAVRNLLPLPFQPPHQHCQLAPLVSQRLVQPCPVPPQVFPRHPRSLLPPVALHLQRDVQLFPAAYLSVEMVDRRSTHEDVFVAVVINLDRRVIDIPLLNIVYPPNA